MKKTLIRLLTISCLLAAGSLNSVAQEKTPRPDESRPQKTGQIEFKAPPDGTFKVLGPKFAIGKVVKGAPYSATATAETIQTLSDGNQITRKNESKLYRDSEGRARIEQTLETIGKWTADGEAQQHIFINDPVAGVSYNLDPRTHTAFKNVTPQKKPATGAQGETLMSNGQMVQTGKPIIDVGQKKTESLGTQTIEGVTAEGTRATLTIPAGEIGNTLPLEIIDETWYSPELQINVMTKHRDPRSGETTYRLTNLSRSEPDRSLFEVPAGYTVQEGKMPPKPKPMKEEE